MNYLAAFRGGPLGGTAKLMPTSEPYIPVFGFLPPARPTPDSPNEFVRTVTHRYRRYCRIQSKDALMISMYEYIGIDSKEPLG